MSSGNTVWDNLLDQIETRGWAWMYVGPDDGAQSNEDFPSYCYSIGLVDKGLPELIIIGLDPRTSFTVGDELIKRALSADTAGQAALQVPGMRSFNLNTPLHDVFKGTRAMLVDVPREQAARRTLFAMDYANVAEKPLRVIQLLWPDRQGRFPFEEGAAPSFVKAQPVLKDLSPPNPNPSEPPPLLQ